MDSCSFYNNDIGNASKNLRTGKGPSEHTKRIIERKQLHQKGKTERQTFTKIVWRSVLSFWDETPRLPVQCPRSTPEI